MRLLRFIFTILTAFVAAWVFLIYALPWLLAYSPKWCEAKKLTTGICSAEIYDKARGVSEWAKKNLYVTFFGKGRVETLSDAYVGLEYLEDSAKKKIGEDKINFALNKINQGISKSEVVLEKQGFGEKLDDVPKNAQKLIEQARKSLEKLRDTFKKTERRAEEMSRAVEDTREALDALQKVLPEQK